MPVVPPSSKYGNSGFVLGAGAAGWTKTGDLLETKLVSVAIPANTIGLGQIEIETFFSYPNNGNSKTLRVYFSATNDLAGTGFLVVGTTTTTQQQSHLRIANRTTASQVGFASGASGGGWGQATAALTTATVDTTAQTFVVISGQVGNVADTLKLEAYLVRLIPAV